MIRVWGSAMHDGQPRCEIRDVEKYTVGDGEANFRPSRAMVIDEHTEMGRDTESKRDCDGPAKCYPGHPCPGCQVSAVQWWYEWDRRNDERKWRATRETTDTKGWKLSDWCPHENGHVTEASARRCAAKLGFPRVVEMNGHGERFRWVEVGVGSLFQRPT